MTESTEQGWVNDLGGIRIYAGSASGQQTPWVSVLPAGLTLGVMLQGCVDCDFAASRGEHGAAIGWRDHMFGHILATDAVEITHCARQQTHMIGVFVHFEPEELLRMLGTQGQALFETLPHAFDAHASHHGYCAHLQALAWQILSCPLQDASRRLYLSGKAWEMLAFSLAQIEERHACQRATLAPAYAGSLSPADMERLHAVHAMLRAELAQPPTLHECATTVGMNVNKLTSGFRQLFGTSIYAFSKTQRLEQARLLLESGALPVKAVARQFGYSAAGFSTVFRQRFGVPPSALTHT